jgi:hypothetical protein
MGLPEEEAAAQTSRGVLEAAEPLGPAAVARVKEALSRGGVAIPSSDTEPGRDASQTSVTES